MNRFLSVIIVMHLMNRFLSVIIVVHLMHLIYSKYLFYLDWNLNFFLQMLRATHSV